MNKTFRNIAAISVAFLAIAACKKSDDNKVVPPPAASSVTISGTGYNEYQGADAVGANLFGTTVYELFARCKTDDAKGYADVYLYSLANVRPTAGTYNIGGSTTGFGANQLQLLMFDSSAAGGGIYSADTITSVNATITIVDGKVNATIPALKMHGLFTPANGTTHDDSVTFSGTVKVL